MQHKITSPHYLETQEVLQQLGVTEQGLSGQEAEHRREQYGWNDLPEGKTVSWVLLLLKQFKDLMVIILLAAAVISFFTGHYIDVYVILAVVVVNGLIGFIQEMRAQRAVASLKNLLVKKARVLRDGSVVIVNARELVPGDVVILEEGDFIPADIRVLIARSARAVESSLTGESMPVEKEEGAFPEDTPLGDRKNMLWNGTYVAAGSLKGVVVQTGEKTELGKIATDLAEIKTVRTNFQKKTHHLARQMAGIAVISATLIFLIGYFFRSFGLEETLLVTIAVLVSSIPEGLPAMLSVVLAIGAGRMAKRKAIVREFTATEALGAVSVILSDKTGTITENSLTVKKIALEGEEVTVTGEGYKPKGDFLDEAGTVMRTEAHPALHLFLQIAGYCNSASIRLDTQKQKYEVVGDPTEGALKVAYEKAVANNDTFSGIRNLYDFPFNSDHKLRASLVEEPDGKRRIYVVGAPEKILDLATNYTHGDTVKPMEASKKQEVGRGIDRWADEAMRVIALAYADVDPEKTTVQIEDIRNLTWVGTAGITDPPRIGVREAVSACHNAGIRVMMATGDHKKTAIAIAREVGILSPSEAAIAMTEQELEQLSDDAFKEAVRACSVFARLTPAMKLKIATVLQEMGHLIAMTGDGVNDASALKKADIGIAMGLMGTDVAREASRMVLADDNFATIVNAVEEGRIVFNNARRTSFFLLTTNFAEVLVLLSSMALGLPFALTATQILWLNLVTDGFLVLPLSVERGHGNEMEEKPVKKNAPILDREVLPFLLINATTMVVFSLLALVYYLPDGLEKARAGVFFVMAITQVFNVFNMRDLKQSIFRLGFASNPYVLVAAIASIALQVAVIELPFMQTIFRFDPLPWADLIVLTVAASFVLWFGELYKQVVKKKHGR